MASQKGDHGFVVLAYHYISCKGVLRSPIPPPPSPPFPVTSNMAYVLADPLVTSMMHHGPCWLGSKHTSVKADC